VCFLKVTYILITISLQSKKIPCSTYFEMLILTFYGYTYFLGYCSIYLKIIQK